MGLRVAVIELADKHGVEMPIAREVYGVIHEGRTAEQAYRGLIRRTPGAEHEPAGAEKENAGASA